MPSKKPSDKKAAAPPKPKPQLKRLGTKDIEKLGKVTIPTHLARILQQRVCLQNNITGECVPSGPGPSEIRIKIVFGKISAHCQHVHRLTNLKDPHIKLATKVIKFLALKYDLKVRETWAEDNKMWGVLDPADPGFQIKDSTPEKQKAESIPKREKKEKQKSTKYLEQVAKEAALTEFDADD
jgi:hypothetical protein